MVNFKAAKADSGVMCTGATPVASNKCVIAQTTPIAANTKRVYLSVSVWANDSTVLAAAAFTYDF
jgi:hypothetical protein